MIPLDILLIPLGIFLYTGQDILLIQMSSVVVSLYVFVRSGVHQTKSKIQKNCSAKRPIFFIRVKWFQFFRLDMTRRHWTPLLQQNLMLPSDQPLQMILIRLLFPSSQSLLSCWPGDPQHLTSVTASSGKQCFRAMWSTLGSFEKTLDISTVFG